MKIFKLLTSQKEQNMKFLMGSEGRKGLLQALSGLLGTFSGLSLAFSGSVKAREGKDKAPRTSSFTLSDLQNPSCSFWLSGYLKIFFNFS